MIEPLLFEHLVGNWLWTVAKGLFLGRPKDQWPDFELRSPDGTRLLLEVKSKSPSEVGLQHLAERLKAINDPSACFLLVTPTAPGADDRLRFTRVFSDDRNRARWLTIEELPNVLGKPSPVPWDSPKTWSKLQTSALVKGLEEYKKAPIGPAPVASKTPETVLEALMRQFPYGVIERLIALPGTLEDKLGLGSRRDNVTVVLSDMVNFSSLVTASRPDDLKEAMSQYYLKARQAVFAHGGMLDKFIGDAVLAVFGYPEPTPAASINAIRFARELIGIGCVVTASWQAEMNAVIPTGTRIGIATGDIWPINIGQTAIEISLLGDTINLAARLEKNCAVDRFLIDHRTHTAGGRNVASFIAGLGLQQVVIQPANAKGQAFPIKAWTQP